MDSSLVILSVTFFAIAVIYSMVGFGGGSSYLAALAMTGLAYQVIPPIALICNMIVAGGGFIHFVKGGHFSLKKVLPFTVLSIPMAYWGGKLLIAKELFFLLLGLSLLIAAIRMLMPDDFFDRSREISFKKAWGVGLPAGAFLGFLSGLVGIGGGIFLSPILLFLRWVDVKQAGACASFFILVNSFSGFFGQLHKGTMNYEMILPLGLAVFVGGQIGSRIGSFHLPKLQFQRVLAILIASVAIKMIVSSL